MKKSIFVVMAMFAILCANAQSLSVATLSKQGVTTHYYGSTALKSALSAAAHGDTINLSGGTFEVNVISKGVVIRGAGVKAELPTTIHFIYNDDTDKDPYISVTATNNPYPLSIEGARIKLNDDLTITGTNILFMRDMFMSDNSSIIYLTKSAKNLQFINCYVPVFVEPSASGGSVSFVNSYVDRFDNDNNGATCTATFVNSIYKMYSSYAYHSTFVNCIFVANGILPSNAIAMNCVSLYGNTFDDCSSVNNRTISGSQNIFKTYTRVANYTEAETFELTDAAKAAYLGNDGTEVGLYGGVMPFTWTPSYPQISTLTVGERTNNAGLLEVNITVSAGE